MAVSIFKPSPQQANLFNWIDDGAGSCVLEAVAGSGKTTTCIKGIDRMRGDIFFGAYNKKIADEMILRTPKKPGLNISTMHAAGFSAWRKANSNSSMKVEGTKLQDIYNTFDKDFERFASPVVALVSYAKQTGIGALCSADDDSKWYELIEHFDIDTMEADGQVVQLAKILLQKSNAQGNKIIDFDDMIYLPILNKCKMFQYDWVVLDEAQDLNATRRALALAMLRRGGRMVIVGDRNQAIYSFTGADIDSLDQMGAMVSAMQLPLTVSYRCPKAVVAEAQKYVSHIQAHESAPEGEVIRFTAEDDLVKHAVPGDAILCRFNRPLMELVYRFIAEGIPAKVEGREIGMQLKTLARRWKRHNYSTLAEKISEYSERETVKFRSKGKETQAANVEDRCKCLQVIITRCSTVDPTNGDAINRVCQEIDTIFDNNVSGKFVVLSSIHRSKGLQWPTVYYIQGSADWVRKDWVRKDWERQAEKNLAYVAVTRSMSKLILIPEPPKK